METEYPKVLLVLSNTFNPFTGTGVMLTNLFRDWPLDRIASVYSGTSCPDRSLCNLFYRLSDEEIKTRLAQIPPFESKVTSAWLRRYARFVSSANKGAVLE